MKSKCNNENTLKSVASLERVEHSRSHVLTQHDYIISGGKEQGNDRKKFTAKEKFSDYGHIASWKRKCHINH